MPPRPGRPQAPASEPPCLPPFAHPHARLPGPAHWPQLHVPGGSRMLGITDNAIRARIAPSFQRREMRLSGKGPRLRAVINGIGRPTRCGRRCQEMIAYKTCQLQPRLPTHSCLRANKHISCQPVPAQAWPGPRGGQQHRWEGLEKPALRVQEALAVPRRAEVGAQNTHAHTHAHAHARIQTRTCTARAHTHMHSACLPAPPPSPSDNHKSLRYPQTLVHTWPVCALHGQGTHPFAGDEANPSRSQNFSGSGQFEPQSPEAGHDHRLTTL